MAREESMKKSVASPGQSATARISQRIADLGDWRGKTLRRMRRLIREADPDVVEEWKWMNPVWSHDGIICTGESYRNAVKLTFAKGASLRDPHGLFTSSLDGKVRRAIDIREGEEIDASAFKALVLEAVALNRRGKPTEAGNAARRGAAATAERATLRRSSASVAAKPVLLAGGNPQIAKADGDAPVQAYITAMPGWKRNVGRRLDALITRTVPGVRKAVKWNSPFYGMEGDGWFLNFHCFTRYVKVAFFRGTSLDPLPPAPSRHKEVRYLDIHEDDELDETLLANWIRQASKIPGWMP
jgi:hypothetical protein